eukprot:3370662-Rhodomonas_salina.2
MGAKWLPWNYSAGGACHDRGVDLRNTSQRHAVILLGTVYHIKGAGSTLNSSISAPDSVIAYVSTGLLVPCA